MQNKVNISIFGDTSDWNINNFDINNIPKNIIKDIKKSDISIFNLEGPIKKNPHRREYSDKPIINKLFSYLLRVLKKEQPIVFSTEKIIELFKLSKRSILTLANNHIKDAGKAGLVECLQILKNNKIEHVGIELYKFSKDFFEINTIDKKIIIYNYNLIGIEKNGFYIDLYGKMLSSYGGSYLSLRKIKNKLKSKKEKHCDDIILLILHFGKMRTKNIDKKVLNELEKIDADIIVLHHAHEDIKIQSKKIFYLGDFVFSYPGLLPDNRIGSYLNAEIDIGNDQINIFKKRYKFYKGYPKL